ncbi:ankyrin [Hypoxylon cercidicola]|nr:ankyrin [Hypoxylon cercidicola]
MNSASPTTSTSTNRGGRPKDWTEQRARRLVRLYIYTRLPFDLILKLLEEGVWKPGKDAANKVKNSLLGNDPRWIRPKDEDDERRRIAALRGSRRGAKHCKRPSASGLSGNDLTISAAQEDDNLTLTQSRQPSFETSDIVSQPTFGFGIGSEIPNGDHVDDHDNRRFSWRAGGINTARQDTGLTNSTETSMSSSFREKLTNVSRDQAKGAWRVLKQFTFPRDPNDLQRGGSFSPIVSPGSQFQPSRNFHGVAAHDPSSARYAVPGDFLRVDLSSDRVPCDIESTSHQTKTCWCRIVDDLLQDPTMLPFSNDSISASEISSYDFYQKDTYDNTAFHRLAAMNGDKGSFISLISHALQYPDLPVRATNTAGQTFLHTLHHSWFDEAIFLDELLNILKDTDFNILAADVYGRTFFHVLQHIKQDAARIPAHLFDWNLRRRDAFGVKPMESRSRQLDATAAQVMRRSGPSNSRSSGMPEIPPTIIDIPSNLGDESRIRPQTEMLRIVFDAVKVDTINSTQPDPRSEDSRGRNAFHCLAEVELSVQRIRDPIQDTQRQKKRKFKEEDEESKPVPSRHNQRLELLQGLIYAKVDVNHYDSQGQTPLMSFIKYRPEESRADKEEMEKIIRTLYEAGAGLEKRNRQGETALHVAARSGKKVALKELLQLGANPYVRDACGLSVLAAIDELWINTEADGALTARLEACRGVFTSVVKADAQEPTVLQEWGAR